MHKTQVIEVIKREREYQDKTWPRTDPVVQHMYTFAASHLLLLKGYIEKARKEWEVAVEPLPILRQLAKLAAMVVRAFQEHQSTKGQDPYKLIERRIPALEPISEEEGQYEAPHLIALEKLINEAYFSWQPGYESRWLSHFALIGAAAFRALEQIDDLGKNLLIVGLRDQVQPPASSETASA